MKQYHKDSLTGLGSKSSSALNGKCCCLLRQSNIRKIIIPDNLSQAKGITLIAFTNYKMIYANVLHHRSLKNVLTTERSNKRYFNLSTRL